MSANKSKPRVRKDPKARPLNGSLPWNEVKNKDPHMFYVLVNKGDDMFGPEYYEWLGYEPVIKRAGGPCMAAGKTVREGEAVEARGSVLMQIPLERKEEIDQYGPDGMTGQASIDRIEDQIIHKRGSVDGMRGIQPVFGRYGDIENETSGLTEEYDL